VTIFRRIGRRAFGAVLRWTLGLALFSPLAASADTVASLLGDFTINQYCGLRLEADAVRIHYVVVFGQLPALRELHLADANADGVTSQAERDAYATAQAAAIADKLVLEINGARVPLRATGAVTSLPTEQTGFSMRYDIDLAGTLPALTPGDARALAFDNRNFPGRIGWHEIVVESAPGITVFDTNAFSTSATGALSQALQALPPGGPLDERTVHANVVEGTPPRGAAVIGTRSGEATPVAAPAAVPAQGGLDTAWLQIQTRRLIELISAKDVSPGVLALALLLSMVLGALHAFSPGHGKTIVGAYLVGSRGTPRHALFLGITVTITHTLVVFAIGIATLIASRYVVPERLFPVLSLLSGALVLGMGVVLFAQRWRSAHQALLRLLFGQATHSHHDHGPDHDHDHDHDHAAPHSHAAAHLHSHGGGKAHSHLPIGDNTRVSWRGLLALGISGGLLPCPSAMVLLLAAVALQKTFYGLLLTIAFSVGLAITLTGVGLAFLYARQRFGSRLANGPWTYVLPLLSALLITVVGAVLCYGALASRTI
jgi:ABC-type nickel/cobalt efflux system permease component RcnA